MSFLFSCTEVTTTHNLLRSSSGTIWSDMHLTCHLFWSKMTKNLSWSEPKILMNTLDRLLTFTLIPKRGQTRMFRSSTWRRKRVMIVGHCIDRRTVCKVGASVTLSILVPSYQRLSSKTTKVLITLSQIFTPSVHWT